MIQYLPLSSDSSEKVEYNLKGYPIYTSYGYLSTYPNYTYISHWHDDIEFIVIIKGEMTYAINGEHIFLKEGEGLFVNSRQMHYGYSANKSECEFICIILPLLILSSMKNAEYDFVLPITRNSRYPYIHLTPSISWQSDVIEKLASMYSIREDKTAPIKIQSSFLDIWATFYDNIPKENLRIEKESVDLAIIKKMVSFIEQNFEQKITLTDIALSGAVGQSKCCKMFAYYFDKSPIAYLTAYRLDKSVQLLKTTELTITQIALTVGFSGASYFTETFRKHFGITPKEARKHM